MSRSSGSCTLLFSFQLVLRFAEKCFLTRSSILFSRPASLVVKCPSLDGYALVATLKDDGEQFSIFLILLTEIMLVLRDRGLFWRGSSFLACELVPLSVDFLPEAPL